MTGETLGGAQLHQLQAAQDGLDIQGDLPHVSDFQNQANVEGIDDIDDAALSRLLEAYDEEIFKTDGQDTKQSPQVPNSSHADQSVAPIE